MSIEEKFKNLKTPTELMEFMNANIEYGCLGKDGNIHKNDMTVIKQQLQLLSIVDILNNGIGTCLEQVELERAFFINNTYPVKTYAMKVYKDENLKEEATVRIHCVLVFFDNGLPYTFEHSWEDYRGITKFQNLEDVFEHLVYRYQVWGDVLEKGYNYYKIVEYDKPPLGMDFEGLKIFTNNSSPIIVGEIVKTKNMCKKY